MLGRHMDEMSMTMGDGTRVTAHRLKIEDHPSTVAYEIVWRGRSVGRFIGTVVLGADGWQARDRSRREVGERVQWFDDACDMLVRWEQERRRTGS